MSLDGVLLLGYLEASVTKSELEGGGGTPATEGRETIRVMYRWPGRAVHGSGCGRRLEPDETRRPGRRNRQLRDRSAPGHVVDAGRVVREFSVGSAGLRVTLIQLGKPRTSRLRPGSSGIVRTPSDASTATTAPRSSPEGPRLGAPDSPGESRSNAVRPRSAARTRDARGQRDMSRARSPTCASATPPRGRRGRRPPSQRRSRRSSGQPGRARTAPGPSAPARRGTGRRLWTASSRSRMPRNRSSQASNGSRPTATTTACAAADPVTAEPAPTTGRGERDEPDRVQPHRRAGPSGGGEQVVGQLHGDPGALNTYKQVQRSNGAGPAVAYSVWMIGSAYTDSSSADGQRHADDQADHPGEALGDAVLLLLAHP